MSRKVIGNWTLLPFVCFFIQFFLQIWNVRQKVKTIDMKALDKHGDVVGNDGKRKTAQ